LGGLLILAFLWYSINISIPRAESRRFQPFPRAVAEEAKKKEADIAKEISAARESHGLTDPRARERYNDQARRDFVAAGVLKLNAKKEARSKQSMPREAVRRIDAMEPGGSNIDKIRAQLEALRVAGSTR
jgi:hypothetical protein